jgi:hypothetical protein
VIHPQFQGSSLRNPARPPSQEKPCTELYFHRAY